MKKKEIIKKKEKKKFDLAKGAKKLVKAKIKAWKLRGLLLETKIISKARQELNRWHKYHILEPSKWPICLSIALLGVALNLVKWLSGFGFLGLFEMLIITVFFLFYWWSDVIRESGEHTIEIIKGIRLGMILFIISEVMFFFAFFWSFFHSSLNPSIELGAMWPPAGFSEIIINPESLPLLNTLLLLSSGLFVTNVHNIANLYTKTELELNIFGKKSLRLLTLSKHTISSFRYKAFYSCFITIFLAVLFTVIQLYEYTVASFNISDGIYGSCFYLLTGFHGFHVLVGTIFLTIAFWQFFSQITTHKTETGLECAIWYWHFVDVVWLFLYAFLYCWSWSGIDNQPDTKSIVSETEDELCIIGISENKQISFQQPVTLTMQNIIALHHDIMYWLILILFIVLSILLMALDRKSTIKKII
jgi:cytochrome c oxidase subunit 3